MGSEMCIRDSNDRSALARTAHFHLLQSTHVSPLPDNVFSSANIQAHSVDSNRPPRLEDHGKIVNLIPVAFSIYVPKSELTFVVPMLVREVKGKN